MAWKVEKRDVLTVGFVFQFILGIALGIGWFAVAIAAATLVGALS